MPPKSAAGWSGSALAVWRWRRPRACAGWCRKRSGTFARTANPLTRSVRATLLFENVRRPAPDRGEGVLQAGLADEHSQALEHVGAEHDVPPAGGRVDGVGVRVGRFAELAALLERESHR